MAATDDTDYWTRQADAAQPPPLYKNQPNITAGVEPLGIQNSVSHLKTVPDALQGPLFRQPENGTLHTYAIIDAAKVPNLPELLENSGLNHRCLFKGNAYDELKYVAPWIVHLEDDNTFTRNLFTRSDTPWHLWDVAPGIFIRSRAALDDLWKHCRKFTRVQNEDGKWYYFRFWEPRHFGPYLTALNDNIAHTQRWFIVDGSKPVEILLLDTEDEKLLSFKPPKNLPVGRSNQPFKIGPSEVAILSGSKKNDFTKKLKQYLLIESEYLGTRSNQDQNELVQKLVSHAFFYDIRIERSVANFALASLIFGRPLDSDPVMKRHLTAKVHQNDRARLVLNEARARHG